MINYVLSKLSYDKTEVLQFLTKRLCSALGLFGLLLLSGDIRGRVNRGILLS
ncbi:hypothetical protein AB4114_34735 [Paenibacillus sp. 2RAB27]|uniref:hypothetical protein n=1 Tax=Paenibacillus sp. 2RAB27 TaxID=3232991 RepID=UPI003F946C85